MPKLVHLFLVPVCSRAQGEGEDKGAGLADGDWGFGATSERWAGGQRTATVILRSDPAACPRPEIFDRPTL